eukprot:c45617_g1_i1.p1 GENE.c45617_g1_i1~~c45617_g1_i1.p1  ORF type:complete len:718 (+),score=114.55 c45617_g1_i1:51-2204(+)
MQHRSTTSPNPNRLAVIMVGSDARAITMGSASNRIDLHSSISQMLRKYDCETLTKSFYILPSVTKGNRDFVTYVKKIMEVRELELENSTPKAVNYGEILAELMAPLNFPNTIVIIDPKNIQNFCAPVALLLDDHPGTHVVFVTNTDESEVQRLMKIELEMNGLSTDLLQESLTVVPFFGFLKYKTLAYDGLKYGLQVRLDQMCAMVMASKDDASAMQLHLVDVCERLSQLVQRTIQVVTNPPDWYDHKLPEQPPSDQVVFLRAENAMDTFNALMPGDDGLVWPCDLKFVWDAEHGPCFARCTKVLFPRIGKAKITTAKSKRAINVVVTKADRPTYVNKEAPEFPEPSWVHPNREAVLVAIDLQNIIKTLREIKLKDPLQCFLNAVRIALERSQNHRISVVVHTGVHAERSKSAFETERVLQELVACLAEAGIRQPRIVRHPVEQQTEVGCDQGLAYDVTSWAYRKGYEFAKISVLLFSADSDLVAISNSLRSSQLPCSGQFSVWAVKCCVTKEFQTLVEYDLAPDCHHLTSPHPIPFSVNRLGSGYCPTAPKGESEWRSVRSHHSEVRAQKQRNRNKKRGGPCPYHLCCESFGKHEPCPMVHSSQDMKVRDDFVNANRRNTACTWQKFRRVECTYNRDGRVCNRPSVCPYWHTGQPMFCNKCLDYGHLIASCPLAKSTPCKFNDRCTNSACPYWHSSDCESVSSECVSGITGSSQSD